VANSGAMKSLLVPLLLVLTSCASDSEYALKANRDERAQRTAAMQDATRQTPRGAPLAGPALLDAVAGRTHLFEYETRPNGERVRYVVTDFFARDGHLVHLDHWAARKADPQDAWRIDGGRLCERIAAYSTTERCFALALDAQGRIQYYVDAPGEPSHGLLTSVTSRVIDGPVADE